MAEKENGAATPQLPQMKILGQFIKDIKSSFGDNEKLVTSEITSKDDIMDSIKEFLKGGR